MADERDYALLSNSVYKRAPVNSIDPGASGWTEREEWRKDDPITGFSARVYEKGDEIVIAFVGTETLILVYLRP